MLSSMSAELVLQVLLLKRERGREGGKGVEGGREGDAEVSYIPLWGVGCFAYW